MTRLPWDDPRHPDWCALRDIRGVVVLDGDRWWIWLPNLGRWCDVDPRSLDAEWHRAEVGPGYYVERPLLPPPDPSERVL